MSETKIARLILGMSSKVIRLTTSFPFTAQKARMTYSITNQTEFTREELMDTHGRAGGFLLWDLLGAKDYLKEVTISQYELVVIRRQAYISYYDFVLFVEGMLEEVHGSINLKVDHWMKRLGLWPLYKLQEGLSGWKEALT